MSNAFQQLPTISWEEFTSLEWPHEWVEGVAYAMGATTPRHAQICARLARQLPDRGPCSAYAAGLVVYVAEVDRGFLPDLVVIGGAPQEAPGKPGAVTNPSIVFEVLSSSTQVYDRTTKLEAYQRLASLQAYVLLHQQGARAEIFRRSSGQGWTSVECAGGILELPGGLRVDLDAL
jgi:Uma2 family endonuclease